MATGDGVLCTQVFAEEMALIQCDELRQFVVDVFEALCPVYFWTVPASTSGRYHPSVALGQGGLIRHVKLAVWWGKELCRALDVPDKREERGQHLDEVTTALLLHDLVKNGFEVDGKMKRSAKATASHGAWLCEAIWKQVLQGQANERQRLVLFAIAGHMGIWTADDLAKYRPASRKLGSTERQIAMLVHIADYAASRKVDAKAKELTTATP